MVKKKIVFTALVDKLLYVFLIVAFFVTAVTAVSTAKYSSKVNTNLVSNVSNAVIKFEEGGNGEVELSNWKPGDSKTINFTVCNFNDKDEVNEIAITYKIKVRTSALLPLTFTLTKTVDSSSSQATMTHSVENGTTFSVYSTNEMTLKHSIKQTDSYSLFIEWPDNIDNSDALEAGGEYIKIILEWKQYIIS